MVNSSRFAGRTMIVTGAAQGIGRGVAVRAAAEGARVRSEEHTSELQSH